MMGLLRFAAAALSLLSYAQAAPSSVDHTILIFARADYDATNARNGLQGYGIPSQTVLVPKDGVTLPALNTSATEGSFGGIIVMGGVSYEYEGGNWRSALTDAQWQTLFNYQKDFNVRMVRTDEYPGPAFGASALGGCCGSGVEQPISFTNTTGFPTANLKTNAGITTEGLYHYPATITDGATTWEVAKFAPAPGFTADSTAAVINNFSGREQMVFFIGWATDWSATSNYLQHAFIHWMTRGLFLGKRKVHLGLQIDDLQLSTELYLPANTEFKTRIADVAAHVSWQSDLSGRAPSGSNIKLEFGHNGNGQIIAATDQNSNVCIPPEAVDYPFPPDTELEFKKPLGTGTDKWPSMFEEYQWTKTCAALDDFGSWFSDQANRDAFMHVSHTFTHLPLNNATYHDTAREIRFNQDWMAQNGIDKSPLFSPKGLIPPQITGLHNGDAIKAWMDNGIIYVVGDNTRPVLRSLESKYHPLITNVADNGYAGLTIVPRYATTIYYNCDTPACTLQEWIDTSGGSGNFDNLLKDARMTNTRYLLGLQADPYMFHQANLRQNDMAVFTVGSKSQKMSLVMIWAETIVQEMTRLTNWPITTLKHDDIARYFIDRKTLDSCSPKMRYRYNTAGTQITSVTVTTQGNTCSVPVPVTIPGGSVTAAGGSITSDQVGSEPTITWVTMNGSPVTLTLSQAVSA